MNFTDFYIKKYSHVPYDFNHNPFGFKHNHGSDISAHLPFLEFIASLCDKVTEFGTRECYSTCAFIKGAKEKVTSYDIQTYPDIELLKTLELPCNWEFIIQDTSDPKFEIEETDFLFIDSLHTAQQVKAELRQADKVKKYIGFHDTFSQGEISLDILNELGILPALREFLEYNTNWSVAYHTIFNHGLTIIKRND